MALSTTSLLEILVILLLSYLWLSNRKPKRNLPPGPKGLPILGNSLQLPDSTTEIAEHFRNLSKEYGPLFYLNIAGQGTIVINSLKTARELLINYGAYTSDRPRWPIQRGTKHHLGMAGQNYDDQFKAYRRINTDLMAMVRRGETEVLQEAEARFAILSLFKRPEDYQSICDMFAASISFSISFGKELHTKDDPTYKMAREVINDIIDAVSPGWMVDLFPFLDHIPLPNVLAPWKGYCERIFEKHNTFISSMWKHAREELPNIKTWSTLMFTNKSVERVRGGKDACVFLLLDMYAAAADTTTLSIQWIMLAAMAYPDLQKKVREEIDRVVGKERAPTFSDRPLLRYTEAFILEAMRWRTVAPLSLPHNVQQDFVYEGFDFPAQTDLYINQYAILHDPEVFDKPDDFIPERYLADDGGLVDFGFTSFGLGPRHCPGEPLAVRSLFVVISCLFWAFEIRPKKDADGNDIPFDVNASTKFATPGPLPLAVDIIPRDQYREEVIKQEFDTVPKDLAHALPFTGQFDHR